SHPTSRPDSPSSGGGEQQPVVLANASDVSHLGYFQRPAAREFILFVALRTPAGRRQSVQHEEYKVHCYNQNGLCAIAFTDDHYPVRSAFSLLSMVPLLYSSPLLSCEFPITRLLSIQLKKKSKKIVLLVLPAYLMSNEPRLLQIAMFAPI
ncbi:VAMP-like protein YKT61, partial [Phragmites australis]|uniref:VAMP-like protein YKT61 n=1 Tax=Phragmites australis TaxID=29695 RepID=UPI002D7972F6